MGQQLNAGLSPLAFKKVNQCFKRRLEYCSPCFGYAALESGLIENLRFLNVNARFKDTNQRNYMKDAAPLDDPFMTMITILFPSPAGQLTSETAANDNIGKLCTIKNIAQLINFAHRVRTTKKVISIKNVKMAFNTLKLDIKNSFPNLSQTSIKKLLFNIIKAIAQEKRDWPDKKKTYSKKALTKKPFYPKYFVEHIITAFFCHKFTDQDALKKLLKKLNTEIIDRSKIKKIDGLFTKKDIAPALKKLRNKKATLDDLWILINKDSAHRVTPYKNYTPPVSNGGTRMYSRQTNKLSNENEIFSDCVETVLRHMVNLLLYEPIGNTFNLSGVPKNHPPSKNLKDFYTLQTPDKANMGDIVMRSAWNKVVADLGSSVVYQHPFGEVLSNNMPAIILNIIAVFKTLFNLELPNRPTYTHGHDDAFIQEAADWTIEGFKTLTTTLNPNQRWDITLSDIEKHPYHNDITGNINITVSDIAKRKLFSFTIRVASGHAYLDNLVITHNESMQLLPPDHKQLCTNLDIANHYHTSRSSLLLLQAGRLTPQLISKFCSSYQLFNQPINDSASIVKALSQFYNLIEKQKISYAQATPILTNLLHNFLWSDRYSIRKLMPTLHFFDDLKKRVEQPFAEILKTKVKALALSKKADNNLLEFYVNIEYLYACDDWDIKFLDLSECPHLKAISLVGTQNLKTITVSGPMNNLRRINLNSSGITSLELPECPHLKKIELIGTKSLKTLTFSAPLNILETIKLNVSGIEKNIGIEHCPKIKRMKIPENIMLEEFAPARKKQEAITAIR